MNARREIAEQMADAARSLLDSFSPDQLDAATWPFSDQERQTWFYTPADHGGLALADMSSDQHRRTHRLLAAGLSHAGYVTAATIMGLENVLDRTEGWAASFGRERGRDPMLYWVAIFGEPEDAQWAWRFGGHHISVHYTMVDGHVVSATPNFLGADPATSPLLGPHLLRPLAAAEDLGRELVHALSAPQLSIARLALRAPIDIVGANRSALTEGDNVVPLPLLFRGRLPQPFDDLMAKAQVAIDAKAALTDADREALAFSTTSKGIPVSSLADGQVEILRALLDTYIDRLPDGLAALEQAKLEGSKIEQLSFAWAGGLEVGEPHYYRIQSSDLLVEYDNTQRDVNHVHTVWRDLSNDFGTDALAEHYRHHDHHG